MSDPDKKFARDVKKSGVARLGRAVADAPLEMAKTADKFAKAGKRLAPSFK